jgi:hypothetical protein
LKSVICYCIPHQCVQFREFLSFRSEHGYQSCFTRCRISCSSLKYLFQSGISVISVIKFKLTTQSYFTTENSSYLRYFHNGLLDYMKFGSFVEKNRYPRFQFHTFLLQRERQALLTPETYAFLLPDHESVIFFTIS